MRKVLLILVSVIGFSISLNAQDVILKKDTAEIKANHSDCVKNTAFGLDIGIGGGEVKEIFSSALGIRMMHHFSPYFGIDFFKINWITDVAVYDGLWTMAIQIMSGVRANSPAFYKCMSVYGAFRLGYGMHIATGHYWTQLKDVNNFKGLCLETELGVNITSTFFVGFSYNYHKCFKVSYITPPQHTFFTRVGFNFGKNVGRGKVASIKTPTQKPYNDKFESVSNKREKDKIYLPPTGIKLLGYGIGVSAVGVFFMIPGFVTGDYKLPVVVAGSIITGVGGGLTIASIPVLVVGAKERVKKNDFAIENFGIYDNSYQPTLNLAYIGNGIGVSLKF